MELCVSGFIELVQYHHFIVSLFIQNISLGVLVRLNLEKDIERIFSTKQTIL